MTQDRKYQNGISNAKKWDQSFLIARSGFSEIKILFRRLAYTLALDVPKRLITLHKRGSAVYVL